MKSYISGPMSGYPDKNRAEFDAVAVRLRAEGHEVISPPETDPPWTDGMEIKPGSPEWQECMKKDVADLASCEAVVVLKGWQRSKGSKEEISLARLLGIKVLDAETMKPLQESVTAEADRLVYSERTRDYDHPLDNFRKTAIVWTGLLYDKLKRPITEEEVGLMMVGVKLAREAHKHKRDNLVDMAGYAQTINMVLEERKRRGMLIK